MTSQSFDALIVGGGPAGTACAWALQRAGMRTAVIDQANFPRDKVCAGWITPSVLRDLEISPQNYGREHVLQPFTQFRLGLLGKEKAANSNADHAKVQPRTSVVRYPETVSYGIRRCEFDNYLLQRSKATLITGEHVQDIHRDSGGWLINARWRAPMLVGAGGHTCPVARILGARPGDESVVIARELEVRLSDAAWKNCRLQGERPELYFCHDLAGYAWSIRKGDYLNIGLGRTDRHGLATHVDHFLHFLREQRGVPKLAEPMHGHAYLLSSQSRRTKMAHGVLLAGDAAGLAYPQSGEGIRPAVTSGLLAAQIIVEARRDYRPQRLAPYLERLDASFPAPTKLSDRVGAILPEWLRGLLGRQLFRLPQLARRIVLDHGFLQAH